MRTLLFLLTGLFSIGIVQSQNQEVTISANKLSDQVYMLTGRGGNIGIYVGENQVFMVDDQFARLSDKIKEAIKGITNKPISVLVNTHMHGDHTGGNANFNSDKTTLVAHDNVRKRLVSSGKERIAKEQITQADYEKSLPEITFSNELTLYDGDETVMTVHVHNAHTDGDTLVFFVTNNVLHMGDTYFAGRYPFIDTRNGGSIDGFIAAHKKALLLIDDETKIIPGHGAVSNKAELASYVGVLQELRQLVQTEIDAGKSLEEIKANSGLTEKYDANYASNFITPERIKEAIFKSLTKK